MVAHLKKTDTKISVTCRFRVRFIVQVEAFSKCEFCLLNDLYCVGWGVKLYSLTSKCEFLRNRNVVRLLFTVGSRLKIA